MHIGVSRPRKSALCPCSSPFRLIERRGSSVNFVGFICSSLREGKALSGKCPAAAAAAAAVAVASAAATASLNSQT